MACVLPTISSARESALSHVDRPRTPDLSSKGGPVTPPPSATMAYKEEATPKPGSADLARPATPPPDPESPQTHKAEDRKAEDHKTEDLVVKAEEDDSVYLDTDPKVVECTWEQFKNRFQNADKTGFEIATVELLMTSETLDEDIETERLRRMDKERREKYLAKYRRPTQPRHAATWTSGLPFERVRINSSIVNTYLARVSGNGSWPVKPHTFLIPFAFLIHNHDAMRTELKKLEDKFGPAGAGVTGEEATVQPREIRPLSKDEVLEEAMVSKKAYLQMKCYVEFVGAKLIPHYNQFDEANHSKPKKIRFDDLWCLFRYGELLCRPNNSAAVRRHDRAALFGPYYNGGDGVRTTHHGPLGGASASVDTHTVIRAKGISVSGYKWDVNVEELDDDDYRRSLSREAFVVEGFYLDYDGTKFAPVSTYIEIEFFRGEMEIHKLPVFPIRFLGNEKSLLEQLRDRGERFRDLVIKARGGREAFSHDGWSRTTTPLGKPITMTRQTVSSSWIHNTMREAMSDALGLGAAAEVQPEYISSDIIVDFQEAYQSIPAWRPDFDTSKTRVDTMPDVLFDSFPIMCWADKTREKEVAAKMRELVVADDRVASVLWNDLVQRDPFSSSEPNDDTRAEKQAFKDHDLVLLPSRVMAYALRDRKFFNADVSSIREITWPPENTSPFNLLKINRKHKDMILSIVHEHFDKKTLAAQLQQLAGSSGGKGGGSSSDLELTLPDQDFIRGKGKGLVILLHGAPGVGKTATAEAVALSRRRPLFLITCGDLGTTPETVEGGLKQIFRLASLWDCILLLDEADIFLSQREKGDESITRNAMVSIFLRTLEYYPGILFLTTNRPGVLDEAVKSRVHVSLHYPAFTLGQTLELFEMNIGRLEDIEQARVKAQRASKGSAKQPMTIRKDEILDFAKKHYNEEESLRWNGRQIRNAFQIAASLAHFQQQERGPEDKDGDTGKRRGSSSSSAPYIGKKHFKQVAQATAEFDRMRRDLLRMSDSDLAYNRSERAPGPAPQPDNYDNPYQGSRYGPGGTTRGSDAGGRRSGRHYRDYDDGWPDERGYSGRGGGGERYARDGSAGPPPPRRDRHRDRDRRDRRDKRDSSGSRSRSRSGSGSRSRSRSGSGSRSSSRSSSPPGVETRHHGRDGDKKQRESGRTSGGRDSGRRSGEKSGPGGEADKYSRRRGE
ncbi:hypothetical protein B0I37DRAFT_382754 [Chaetomium sp. MPI-CAGE-AT-0009]|nr:hypothetical protein B0I37DRAFT_382754 [Chaetomium sp. MPI-CAGE-AT-0009]